MEGKDLIDGVAYGKAWGKAPEARPQVRIPPRKKARIAYDRNEDEEARWANQDMREQNDGRGSLLIEYRGESEEEEDEDDPTSVRIRATFDDLDMDGDEDDEFRPVIDEEIDEDMSLDGEEETRGSVMGIQQLVEHVTKKTGLEELPLFIEDNNVDSDCKAPAKNSGLLQAKTTDKEDKGHLLSPSELDLRSLDQIASLRAAFPNAPVTKCESLLLSRDHNLKRAYKALRLQHEPVLDYKDLPIFTLPLLPPSSHDGQAETTKSASSTSLGKTRTTTSGNGTVSTLRGSKTTRHDNAASSVSSSSESESESDSESDSDSEGSESDSDSDDSSRSEPDAQNKCVVQSLSGGIKLPIAGKASSDIAGESSDTSSQSDDFSSESESEASALDPASGPGSASDSGSSSDSSDPSSEEQSDLSSDDSSSDASSSEDETAKPTPAVKKAAEAQTPSNSVVAAPTAPAPIAAVPTVGSDRPTKTQLRNARRRARKVTARAEALRKAAESASHSPPSASSTRHETSTAGNASVRDNDFWQRKQALLNSLAADSTTPTKTKPADSGVGADVLLTRKTPPTASKEKSTAADESPQRRMKLDIKATRRFVFGALGLAMPKTTAEGKTARQNIVEEPSYPQAAMKEVEHHSSSESRQISVHQDPENAWKSRITYTAVECSPGSEDVVLAEPPFPFVQRWDPQQQYESWHTDNITNKAGIKRKRHDDTDPAQHTGGGPGGGKKGRLAQSFTTTQLADGQKAASCLDIRFDDDLPVAPADATKLDILTRENVKVGMVITWKQLICSKATQWRPEVVGRTAVVKASNEDELDVLLAKRDQDVDRNEKEFDMLTGQRLYHGFEAPDPDSDEDDGVDDGHRAITMSEMIDPRILQHPTAASLDHDAHASTRSPSPHPTQQTHNDDEHRLRADCWDSGEADVGNMPASADAEVELLPLDLHISQDSNLVDAEGRGQSLHKCLGMRDASDTGANDAAAMPDLDVSDHSSGASLQSGRQPDIFYESVQPLTLAAIHDDESTQGLLAVSETPPQDALHPGDAIIC